MRGKVAGKKIEIFIFLVIFEVTFINVNCVHIERSD